MSTPHNTKHPNQQSNPQSGQHANQALDVRTYAAGIAVQVEAAMHSDLAEALADCDLLLVEVIQYALFNGGKRIRPLLAVLCSRCCGRDDADLYLLAAAFEYLHVATLIHDDIIDRATQRRGKDTVMTRYGLTPALLVGDWLHARSMHLMGRLVGQEGLSIFCQATLSMVNGEFAQLRHANDLSTQEHHYFEVIRQKTSNLIASACALGALFAGASPLRRQALASYGNKIGTAFQIVDDILDFQGDAQLTGKVIGNDFVEGKITLPLLHTLAHATETDRQHIIALMHGDRSQPAAYQQLVALIDRYKGCASAAQSAQQLIHAAINALAPFSASAKEGEHLLVLQDLARYILARNK